MVNHEPNQHLLLTQYLYRTKRPSIVSQSGYTFESCTAFLFNIIVINRRIIVINYKKVPSTMLLQWMSMNSSRSARLFRARSRWHAWVHEERCQHRHILHLWRLAARLQCTPPDCCIWKTINQSRLQTKSLGIQSIKNEKLERILLFSPHSGYNVSIPDILPRTLWNCWMISRLIGKFGAFACVTTGALSARSLSVASPAIDSESTDIVPSDWDSVRITSPSPCSLSDPFKAINYNSIIISINYNSRDTWT